MTKKLKIAEKPMTRERLVDANCREPLLQRLTRTEAVDLRNNAVAERIEGGYARIRPVDSTRRFR